MPGLNEADEYGWPALTQAMLGYGVEAVFALPVAVAGTPFGALDLYRRSSGPLDDHSMTGGMWAAGLAALPPLDLISGAGGQKPSEGQDSWEQLASLEHVEVCQATGMIVAAFIASPADALVKLRATPSRTAARPVTSPTRS